MGTYLMNNIDRIQYNYFPIDNRHLDLLNRTSGNEHTIDISNFLSALDQAVVEDNKYDRRYHNHHIIEVFLHPYSSHNIHRQCNQDNANLCQKERLKARKKSFLIAMIYF